MQNQWELALEYYVRALEINPNSADAHYGIGRVLLESGEEERAINEMRQVLNLDPSFLDARETLTALGKPA